MHIISGIRDRWQYPLIIRTCIAVTEELLFAGFVSYVIVFHNAYKLELRTVMYSFCKVDGQRGSRGKGRRVIQWVVSLLILAHSPVAWAGWSGSWEFIECWPDLSGAVRNCIVYTLNIRPVGNQFSIDVDIDGFQTTERIKAGGIVSGNNLQVVFQGFCQKSFGSNYKRGDILLELKHIKDRTITEWGKVEPVLEKNKKSGIYFKQEIQK